jgi:hypothetical protein
MGEEETQQALWNFDGAELFLIFDIKSSVVDALKIWDIEEAYRKVRLLRMEIDAKLQRSNKKIIEEFEEEVEKQKKNPRTKKLTEKQEVDNMLIELDNEFTNYNEEKEDDEMKEKIYKKIESFYMHLCYLMKKHGLYFREGEDMRLAVLRR